MISDDAHVLDAGKGELKRARYRRRRQGQHVDVRFEPLEPFLVDDAETLLLVDDQQAEVGEADLFAQQPVGADDDVERAGGQALLGLGDFLRRHQPGDPPDPDRPATEALGEGLVMLARQQGCRHDDGDLGAAHRRHEGGAERDLGLAEADIATDQPVHRPGRGGIVDGISDRRLLIVGFIEAETGTELVIERVGGRHRLGVAELALGRHLQQLLGHVPDAFLEARLAGLPGGAAELIQVHRSLVLAVAAQHLDVLDRHE
jgi:hypothetical protein